jgi:TonB-dependent SusC/RagA subfamily outer membrane receptor
MLKNIILFIILMPLGCFAQFTVTGRILNQSDTKPVANASVFLSNTSIGSKTNGDGAFTLQNVKPGKYDLIISIIGFETYRQSITVNNSNITLPAILILSKTILLNEVKIRPYNDPDRDEYYEWFKDEFLGTSALADECKILNPGIINLDYDKKTSTLTASAPDFLEIENKALGYKIKYLLADFKLSNKDGLTEKVHYEGSALFEEMKGGPVQQRRWKKSRQEVYEGSPMHFLRSVFNSSPEESYDATILPLFFREGFWVLRLARYPNPQRPADSLIQAKINFFKKLRSGGADRQDSLAWWNKKAKLPKTIDKLLPDPLQKGEFVKPTDQKGLLALGLTRDIYSLYINYDKYNFHNGHYEVNIQPISNLSAPQNTKNTLVSFNTPYALFDGNGGLVNPNSLTFSGVWGRMRVAELLPLDYEPLKEVNKIADNIISKLNDFTVAHIPEKVYLQFDKPYYAAGDTLYFKAYVTKGEEHLLSGLSSVLHVDLINTNNQLYQSVKLHLDSGVAWGDFALPDSLRKGNYRVRAYTRWMRNEDNYFDQVIPVGSNFTNKIPKSANPSTTVLNANRDIQFLPEGGSLIAGIQSKIAFKAIGANGLGIDLKGIVIDNENKQVCSFASSHLGMGYFYLNPETDKIYKAKITYADGTQNIVDLPKAAAKGITLSVTSDSLSKIWIRLKADKIYCRENRDKDFTLIISSGDVNTKITCTLDSAVIGLDILKSHLHTGVARLTLFSPVGELLCERLLFVQNHDQLNLRISSDKPEYAKREKVHIKLNAINASGNPAMGHFSVSVTDESTVMPDKKAENNILTNLLLTSDLKGYVEQPNYYFTDTSATSCKNLDALMLTQGYRHFEWKQVLGSDNQPQAYQPEKGLEIAGIAKTPGGKPIANGTVTLIPAKGGQLASTATDAKGMFRFTNLIFTDTARFVLSAVNDKGKNTAKITYFNDHRDVPAVLPNQAVQQRSVTDTTLADFVKNEKLEQREVLNYVNSKAIILREVNIKNKKPDDQYQTQSLAGAGHADQVLHSAQLGYDGPLVSRLNGVLKGVIFIKDIPYLTLSLHLPSVPNQMLLIVDGVETPKGQKISLQTTEVETVEVLKNASASMYGMQGADGVLIITTKQMKSIDSKDIASIGVLPIAPVGFYKAREFYSPKYDHPNVVSKQRDLRSTVYWKPELVTDKDGNASFDYYNADGTGTYKVVIEGIDENGNIGRQVYRYRVQ